MEPLKCISHAQKINGWVLEDPDVLNEILRGLIAAFGLSLLILASYQFINKVVVSAFMERWYPETNTFYMTFREMTIHLDDVSTLLGISIVGRSISLHIKRLSNRGVVIFLVSKLRVLLEHAAKELAGIWGQSMHMEWLRDLFSEFTNFSDGA